MLSLLLTKNYLQTFNKAKADAIAEDMKKLMSKTTDGPNWSDKNSKKDQSQPDNVESMIKDFDLKKEVQLKDYENAFFEKQITDDLKNKEDKIQESTKHYQNVLSNSSVNDTAKLDELSQYCKRLEEEIMNLRLREKEMILEKEHLEKKLMIKEHSKQMKEKYYKYMSIRFLEKYLENFENISRH